MTYIKSPPPITFIQYDLKLSGTVASQAFIKSLMLLKLKNSSHPHPFLEKKKNSEVIDGLSPNVKCMHDSLLVIKYCRVMK